MPSLSKFFNPHPQLDLFNFHRVAWWKQIIVAIVYYITALLSHTFTTYPNTGSTPIWIPGGIAVGLIAIWGYPLWLGVLIGVFIAEFTIFQAWTSVKTLILTILIVVIVTVGKVISVYWMEYLTANKYFLNTAKNTIQFMIYGCFLSHLPVAILCPLLLCIFGQAPWQLYPEIALTWWLSDAFGILIFTPLIVAWHKNIISFNHLLHHFWLESIIILLLTLVISSSIYSGHNVEYLLVPLLVWSAFRFKELGATLLLVIITVIVVIGTVQGYSSFVQKSITTSLLLLQSFLACIGMTTLVLNAILNENEQAKNDLRLANNNLINQNESYSRFVPRQFLQFLNRSSIVDVKLGDQIQLEMSVLFSDIREFTQLSETMKPEDNFKFINSYLSVMEPAITENNGFIDKYIGDAIMALFSGEADNSVKASIAMLKLLAEYNTNRGSPNRPKIKIGIGINTGSLMLGTVGGKNRMDGTVISDAVNLASRVERLTKNYGVSLLITEYTYAKLKNPSNYHMRIIDTVKVKGKSQPVTVYEVFDADLPEIKFQKLATLSIFTEALLLYNQGKLGDAERLFGDCLQKNPGDNVVYIYYQLCQN
jgi:integral membrane sensor domain MASE1/class 3 adenylate cyclase